LDVTSPDAKGDGTGAYQDVRFAAIREFIEVGMAASMHRRHGVRRRTALPGDSTSRRHHRPLAGPAAHRASQPDVTTRSGPDEPGRAEVAMAFAARPTSRHFARASAAGAGGQLESPEPVPLMTPDDVARVLRTSRAAVYKMQERGQLPGVRRIGRRLLFDRATLLDWMGQNPTSSLNGVQ
jgi:excisionase family DNA binding protein